MTLKRFYINPEDIDGNTAHISSDEYIHLTKVLRYKIGYEVIICANDGIERYGKIIDITKDEATVLIDRIEKIAVRNYVLNLYVAILNNNRLDYTIQKCTELGVNKIIPVIFHNCDETKFNTERANRIAKEAAKQCGAVTIPIVEESINYDNFLLKIKNHLNVIFAYEKSTPSKISSLKLGNDIAVVIGPEGGFTESEANDIAETAKTVSLGNRILRAETAAVVATTLVLSNKGEL